MWHKKKETKKTELFLNVNKLREAGTSFNKVIITHDLARKQKEYLKNIMAQAQGKEGEGVGGNTCIR